MSFYRSETVKHFKLILPRDNAQQIMSELGQQNIIHIVPSNTPLLSRPYIHQVKRCNQCLIRLGEVQEILSERSILVKRQEFTSKQYKQFFQFWAKEYHHNRLNSLNILDEIDHNINIIWNTSKQYTKRIQQIKAKIQYFRQNLAIIQAARKQFGNSFFTDKIQKFESLQSQLTQLQLNANSSQISVKAGVIKIDNQLKFKRTLFRITKNNCFVVFVPYQTLFQALKAQQKNKLVYFVFYAGLKGGLLDKKLDRFISCFCPQSYNLPQNINDFDKIKKDTTQKIKQNQNLLILNQDQFKQYLRNISQFIPQRSFSKIQSFKLYLMKQMQTYNQLNQMEVYNNFLQADIYLRNQDIVRFHKILSQIQKKTNYPSGQFIQAKQGNPPTCFIRNKFTVSAQQIVETYGTARYKQANPSFFTVVTFPFLFGVMFGDIAHGAIIMTFGLILIFKKQYFQHIIFKLLAPHCYIITLMGFFSMYCGFIYNDFMSITLNLFGSCYSVASALPGQPIQRINQQCVYPIGIDPVWGISTNELNYVDSLKMKISVIIAVFHMVLGICVKGSNSLYFKKWLDFLFQFIPQLIFMLVLFGYMDFLICYKWLKHWVPYDPNSPSIITTMINMPLKFGQTQDCCGGQPLWGQPGNTSQNSIQRSLFIVALLCVPLMLLPKPLYLIYKVRQKYKKKSDDISEIVQQNQNLNQQVEQKQKQTSSQIIVHQLIQTIQYVLGSISNTASYLRLWALSLAHTQLSEVFFEKTVQSGISKNFSGIPLMIITYPILAGITIGVLLCMDSMECFLHTLRLHWVQFQNKFYKGDGYSFNAFNFKHKISQQLAKN